MFQRAIHFLDLTHSIYYIYVSKDYVATVISARPTLINKPRRNWYFICDTVVNLVKQQALELLFVFLLLLLALPIAKNNSINKSLENTLP